MVSQVVAVVANEDNKDALSHLPAMHPDRVKANLPSEQEQALAAEEMEALADTTKRVGAGGVIPGQVGIRPQGMSKFNEFHEKYTETGKLPKKERPVMDLFAPGARYDGPRFKVVDIPLHLCLYCMKNNLIDLRAPKAEYMLNFMPITPDNVQQFNSLGFIVGDVVRHAICKFCKKRMKQDMNSELMVSHNGEMIPQKYLKAAEHVGKIQDNIVSLLRQCSLQMNETTSGQSVKVEVGS